MRVGPSMWDSLSCEGLLYRYCIGVVNLTFSIQLSSLAEGLSCHLAAHQIVVIVAKTSIFIFL
jgi:hypothetical protein